MNIVRNLRKRPSVLPPSLCTRWWAWAVWQRAMGGGPRTFPGGVNKWQWKRMLVKKREQREQRLLEREKEVYKMRQRADVLAAHPELQQPWEKLATFPPPGVSAQQQVAGLVNRFCKASVAEDLWTPRDGPQGKNQTEQVAGGLKDAMMNGDAAHGNKDESASKRSRAGRGGRQAAVKPVSANKKREVSSIGKSMQDYLDSFETDPLGLAVEDMGRSSRSSKERHRDPLGLLAVDGTRKRGAGSRRTR